MARKTMSKVFMADPVDILGKETTIGLAEHAARTKAPPYVLEKSGNVVFWDDYESSTLKADVSVVGAGTVNRSNDYSQFGELSMKLETGAVAGNSCSVRYQLSGKITGKLGVLASVRIVNPNTYLHVHAYKYDGTNVTRAIIKINIADGKVYCGYPAPTTYVGTAKLNIDSSSRQFVPMKVVVDLDNLAYGRVLVGNSELDLSGNVISSSASGIDPHLLCYISFFTNAGFSYVSYIDHVIVTEKES